MSCAEATFVLGLIFNVISICETTKAIYEAAKDAKGQPETFRRVYAQLNLVTDILNRTQEKAKKIDEAAQDALELPLELIKAKAENLNKIFQKVIRKDDKWYDRYEKAVGTLGKEQKIESLMTGMLKDIQVLVCEKLSGVATEAQVLEIDKAIEATKEMSSSLHDETAGVRIRAALTQNHDGSGNNNANTGEGSQHNGIGDIHQNTIYGNASLASASTVVNATHAHFNSLDAERYDWRCLRDLRTTDPREDKMRIEDSKGGLLKASYQWIFKHIDYQKWHNGKDGRVLWIKGDPGKGKTMLLCGIIDEMSASRQLAPNGSTTLLSYFFCQATDSRINNAGAVLRGLIYLLVDQKRSLLSHVRKSYDVAGKDLFEDANAWVALCQIFKRILQDPSLGSTYLIIDALDECNSDLPKLLDFIVHVSGTASRIKWVISSRNWPEIEEQLHGDRQKITLCLELNPKSVSAAVKTYISYKTKHLAEEHRYDEGTRKAVEQHLVSNANDTFLWAALVCQNLRRVKRWTVLAKLKEFPPGLDQLYDRMVCQIYDNPDYADLCKQILAITSIAYRPITLKEISSLVETFDLKGNPNHHEIWDHEYWEYVIGLCGSFLTLRENTIYLVHQSAKEFLLGKASDRIFPFGASLLHYSLFKRSLQIMSTTLRKDVYSQARPEVLIEEVKQPDPDPLAAARYSCIYWGDHLIGSDISQSEISDLKDDGLLCSFLSSNYLYWLEALSLMKKLTHGITMILTLETWLEFHENPQLHAFIHDARRFAVYNRPVIEKAPLQLYCSALIFTPEKSIVRITFENSIPKWIQNKPRMQLHWNAALQTLEGHSDSVIHVAFSPDGKLVASASSDYTVRLWDAATGAALQTLEGHSSMVNTVAFSPDGKSVSSASYDNTVRLWDAATGAALQTLVGHSGWVTTVAFSPDGKSVASASFDRTVRLWDAETGTALRTLEGHAEAVTTVAFSPDGISLASGSLDRTVRLWDSATRVELQTLVGHSGNVRTVAFSPDGKSVASGSEDSTVRLWDAETGASLRTFESHTQAVNTIAFSPRGTSVVSGSDDSTVLIWDARTGAALQRLEGHSGWIIKVAFSPDAKSVASASYDNTVRLWDAATGASLQTLMGHSDTVTTLAFSPDGKSVASGSEDSTVRLWDAETGASLQTLESHAQAVNTIAFSPKGTSVVSGSFDRTVRLWETATGTALRTLEGHAEAVTTVAFSHDGISLASGSLDRTVRLWDATTGAALQRLEGHFDWVTIVDFSLDGKSVASGSSDRTVRLWNAGTGASLQTLRGHSDFITTVAFSADGKSVASGSFDRTVRLWDAETGAVLHTLEDHSEWVTTVAFSADGKSVASGFFDKTVWIWDVATGAVLHTLKNHSKRVPKVSSPDENSGHFFPIVIQDELFIKGEWILKNGKKLLWIPQEYRLAKVSSHNSLMGLGLQSGCVIIIGFDYGLI